MSIERFVYQFDEYDCEESIYDSKEDYTYDKYEIKSIINLLNQQDQRIAELEEQLKNTRTKYFVGYDRLFNPVVREMDLDIILPTYMNDKDFKFYDTKEEAQAKLEELQGEKYGTNKTDD